MSVGGDVNKYNINFKIILYDKYFDVNLWSAWKDKPSRTSTQVSLLSASYSFLSLSFKVLFRAFLYDHIRSARLPNILPSLNPHLLRYPYILGTFSGFKLHFRLLKVHIPCTLSDNYNSLLTTELLFYLF